MTILAGVKYIILVHQKLLKMILLVNASLQTTATVHNVSVSLVCSGGHTPIVMSLPVALVWPKV